MTNRALRQWFPFKFRRRADEFPADGLRPATPHELESGGLRWFDENWESEFGKDPFSSLRAMESWFGDHSSVVFRPQVDVIDEGNHITVTAELPGLGEDDVQLVFERNALRLRGEKRHEETFEEEGCYHTERSFGFFERTIPLPEEVDGRSAQASFDRGVLTVRFPKLQELEPLPEKKVTVH